MEKSEGSHVKSFLPRRHGENLRRPLPKLKLVKVLRQEFTSYGTPGTSEEGHSKAKRVKPGFCHRDTEKIREGYFKNVNGVKPKAYVGHRTNLLIPLVRMVELKFISKPTLYPPSFM